MNPTGQRRQHALEIDDLPVIQNRDLRRLARRVAQRDQVRMRRLAQVEAAGDDVAEHEALDAELVGAVLLGEKPRLLERRQQAERGRARECRYGSRDRRATAAARGTRRRSAAPAPWRRRRPCSAPWTDLGRRFIGETIYQTVNCSCQRQFTQSVDKVNWSNQYVVRPRRARRNDGRARSTARRRSPADQLLVDHAGAESNTCVGLARLGLRSRGSAVLATTRPATAFWMRSPRKASTPGGCAAIRAAHRHDAEGSRTPACATTGPDRRRARWDPTFSTACRSPTHAPCWSPASPR